ncbi:hypothetical protein BDP55DRAFT_629489 [Colletotrichum godetiae]|uniref:Uncharacterized protein n=1 Tax=Colletotrichum godetiae TaxID=1209918 RepID=A0AAJ0AVN2_9PEZI|nr:uncharacterized protein BDP55DRAFT_629489 [Colletotrichum godetiae]KAK1688954.1 hypothetical protein BDP55DRAFT_629489 [Colletotrichum godetiae]
MAPTGNHNTPKTEPSAPSQRPEDVLDEFISCFGRFCTEKGFRDLKAVVLDHDALQRKLIDTEAAYKKNLEELTQLIADRNAEKEAFKKKTEEQGQKHRKIKALVDEVGRAIADSKRQGNHAATLQNTNSTLSKDLKEAKDKVAISNDELKAAKTDLSIRCKDLTTVKNKLAEIRSHTATLTALEDVRADMYVSGHFVCHHMTEAKT